MKKNLQILLTVVSFFLIVTLSYGQDTYYYYDNNRIGLTGDSNSVVMYFKDNFAFKNRDTTFTSPSIIEIDASDGTEDTHAGARLLTRAVKDGNRPKIITTEKFLWQKMDYIHENPLEKGLVLCPEDYKFSSARNYAELSSLLEVEILIREWITVR